ncbi:amino acid adenylation domain-containing protein [Longispora sp. K20-0274]|uniref:amino acid adenylation domain-containing protein n=1 Tax=Longispora sp. K20-0274 TaxID=3088255 RepID=UPI00399B2D72
MRPGPGEHRAVGVTGLLCDLITEQAARTPDAVAVRQWDAEVTYRELVGRAAALADLLRGHGVGPEVRVGVCGLRTPGVLSAVLGVQLAGGAYVPLDPAHPAERRALMVADAGITVAVVDDAGAAALADSGLTLLRVPDRTAPVPACPAGPDNAAYVMYTSGSSGQPKGVVVAHRTAAQFATSTAGIFDLDADCRSIGFAALGFDVSVLDFYPPLSRGGSIALIPEADRIDATRLQRFLEEHRVTWGVLPPALLPLLHPERLPDLRHALTAGESPGPDQVARWSAPPARRFYNWYGPTECSCIVVGTEVTGTWETTPPIGYPLPECAAHILDEDLLPCPDGTPGELVIGGPHVVRGYLGRPGLTAEKFVPDPFGTVPGARLYRTGDRVVRDPEHGIVHLGRLDRQVKVSGQRVELGEIEAVLRGLPAVVQAVADVTDSVLVAYLTPADAPDLTALREHCATLLPGYMIPTRVVRLPALPLNTSGKVDLAALRSITDGPVSGGRAPGTPLEHAVARAWSTVLGVGAPGLDDDFFEHGGHSLLAMRLVEAVRADPGRAVTVEDVFVGRTLGGLADRAEKAAPHVELPVRPGQPPAMSGAQRRVWFVDRLAGDTPAYNIAFAERLRGPLDPAALARALRAVAGKHEVLRWRFPDTGGAPFVAVDPADQPMPVPVDEAADPDRWLRQQAQRRFDLAEDALCRVRLLRLGEDEHLFALTVHHTVFDGWSQQLLYRDLAAAYAAELAGAAPDLGTLPATFADYVAWQAERERSDDELAWWTARLRDAPTVLDLPRDLPRPAVQTFRGAGVRAALDATGAVRDLATRLGTTPYVVLLAAFGQLLRRLTGQRDLIIGVPVADRGHPAFEPMIGFCVDTVPLRLTVDDTADFAGHVRACAETLTAALARAATPLERIVTSLGVERDLTRNPLVQVLFNMYNFAQPALELPGIAAEPVPAGLPGSLFDLTLYLSENAHGWDLQGVYNPDLYHAERIEALLAGYTRLVGDLVGAPDAPVGDASLRAPGTDLPDPDAPLPRWSGPGVVERVTATARSAPTATAVTGEGGSLDYGQLLDLARRTTAAVTAGGAVGILAVRHVQLPALLLGVLAGGARWAVLDATLPPARLAAQATAAGCVALLACPGVTVPAELAGLPVLEVGAAGVDPVPVERGYLSFTSGTTGEPKAVLTGERPLAHFLDWYPATFDLRSDDRFALLAGVAHDPLLRDVFTPLALGATLHVPSGDLPRDPVRLAGWLAAEGITVVHLTPPLARVLAAVPGATAPALRLVACGGDQLTYADVALLRRFAPAARVVNLYGTTETPQAQGFHRPTADGQGPVPVGRGIDGAQLLIRGPGGQPAGIGELGEVVIRSRYLAAGYATAGRLDVERSRARFAAPRPEDAEDRVYQTGDLGRYRPDGEVVLAGRDDDQVKIRGYRLEPGEVEAAILAHPDVRAATVFAETEQGEVVLRGYAVPAATGLTVEGLRTHLGTLLPGHAIPATLTLLPALPLTPNGKVDRAALPRPSSRPTAGPADTPATATERLIAGTWCEVLGLPRVGTADNFFEIGGHSLAIVAVQARLSTALDRDVDIVDLFRHPNIRALAAHLDGTTTTPGLDRVARRVAARRDRTRRTTTARAADTKGRDA